SGQRRLIPCDDAASHASESPASLGNTLVHWPVRGATGANLIELVFDHAADESARRDVLQLLQRAEPYCAAFFDGGHTAASTPESVTGSDWDRFLLGLHRSLHLSEMCFTIANDGRRLIGCDRVCVLVDNG